MHRDGHGIQNEKRESGLDLPLRLLLGTGSVYHAHSSPSTDRIALARPPGVCSGMQSIVFFPSRRFWTTRATNRLGPGSCHHRRDIMSYFPIRGRRRATVSPTRQHPFFPGVVRYKRSDHRRLCCTISGGSSSITVSRSSREASPSSAGSCSTLRASTRSSPKALATS